jgi:hypothetical protein
MPHSFDSEISEAEMANSQINKTRHLQRQAIAGFGKRFSNIPVKDTFLKTIHDIGFDAVPCLR